MCKPEHIQKFSQCSLHDNLGPTDYSFQVSIDMKVMVFELTVYMHTYVLCINVHNVCDVCVFVFTQSTLMSLDCIHIYSYILIGAGQLILY